MSTETYIIYGITIVLLIISFIKDKHKTKRGLAKGIKTFLKILPILFPLFIIVGIVLALITPEIIHGILGDESGILGYILGVTIGSITFMSPFIAYPLGAKLLADGAAHPQIAGFLVTLTSVGLVYFSMEVKFFNKKAAIYRNVVSLIGAFLVILIVWVIHSW